MTNLPNPVIRTHGMLMASFVGLVGWKSATEARSGLRKFSRANHIHRDVKPEQAQVDRKVES